MYQIDIQEINQDFMLTESDTEAAVLDYLWKIVQSNPVEDYLQDAAKDDNVSTTIAYLRLASFAPFFLRASDIVWDYDSGSERSYSFNDNLRELIIDDEQIKPYTLNIIKNCIQNRGLIKLADFDVSNEDDEDFYNEEKWSFFKDLADCFSIRKYLKSVHINTLTVLFSNICDTEEAQALANSIYCPETSDDIGHDEESDELEEDYEHEFDSQEDFLEFLVQHADELIPKAPTSIQCHLYSYLNGDCD